MNTTKIHIIARDLLAELKRVGTVSLLQQAMQALQQHISQPQQPNHQQQLSSHLTNLYNRLEASPIDDYSPAWRDAMVELGVNEEFGSKLETKIKEIFERNQITLQTALEELTKIHKKISDTESNLTGLVNGLEYFGVGEDILTENECEVGVIVPRSYVHDNMKAFGAELVELEKTLLVFSELATGQREPLRIRQISSSELSVFLQYLPEVGACVAIAVERIVALYKQLLEIKKLKKELVAQKVPEDQLTGIDTHAASIVSPALDKLATELLEKYGSHLDQSRKNEVSIEVRHSLNKLANRIDRGFNIELRVSPIEEEEASDEEETAEEDATKEAIKQIIKSGSKINHLEQTGEPVLFLPEKEEDTEK
ncbi:hypothetical protein [Porticoccus sp.]|nr:MAG: hypothetical protein EP324_06275 [Gammaproteobacteria bacterium]